MSILLIVTLILAFVLHPRGRLKLPKKVATRKVVLAESLVSQPRTLGDFAPTYWNSQAPKHDWDQRRPKQPAKTDS